MPSGAPALVAVELEQWSGMAMFSARTRHRLGWLGRRPTDVHHGVLRSALTGQANAILVARQLSVPEHRRRVLSGRRIEWPEERRVSHGVRRSSTTRGACARLRVVVRPSTRLLHLHLRTGDGRRRPSCGRPSPSPRSSPTTGSRSSWQATSTSRPRPRGWGNSRQRDSRHRVPASTTFSSVARLSTPLSVARRAPHGRGSGALRPPARRALVG